MRLELKNLSKTFKSMRGEVEAFKNINLTLQDKEFFVLLGPSGCGKSTLLNLVAGLEGPSTGEIYFDSDPVASVERRIFRSPRGRNVAMVFQHYALYPHLTVYENIAFPLRIEKRNKAAIDQAVRQAADTLGIAQLLKVKPSELSGGQRQRVAIARAIVRAPNIFLLDEPLSNLDAQLRMSMRTELRNLQRRLKITTLYVTHDQAEAMTLGDRVAILNDGKIEQVGTPLELYNRPSSLFVAQFLGTSPINILNAKIITAPDGKYLEIAGNKIQLPESRIPEIERLNSKDMILAIRPENVRPENDATERGLTGEIAEIELLGKETQLHARVNEIIMRASSDSSDWKIGQQVNLSLDLEKAHFFLPK